MKKIKKFIKRLFLTLFYNAIYKSYICLFGSRDNRQLKYRISLCLIFKDEAPFLKEWLDYHIAIGIDHFYLYNNNSTDNFLEIIQEYIDRNIVTLIDWPEERSQNKCYEHCLKTFCNETKWIGYIDADEFVVPKYKEDINDWFSDWEKFPAVKIDWLQFGTSGVVHHDINMNVIEQYFSCWDHFWLGKTFINTRFKIANWNTLYFHHHSYVYYPILGHDVVVPAINQFGYINPMGPSLGGGRNQIQNSTIQINHYYIKSWDIYQKKMKKTDVLFDKNPKGWDKFFTREMMCISRDYTILRFLMKMKFVQGVIQ